MGLGHEKLDGYRLSIGSVAWVYEKDDGMTGNHRSARDQWLRASQSIPLNRTCPKTPTLAVLPIKCGLLRKEWQIKAGEFGELRESNALSKRRVVLF
jgi:hypothetical protein